MEFLDVLQATFENEDYRRVLFTGSYCQLAAMSLEAGDFIQDELLENDKLFVILRGQGEMYFTDDQGEVREGSLIGIPADSKYRLNNGGGGELKMLAIYAPAEFPEGAVHTWSIDAEYEKSE